jgi:nucleotide-binding universal stress UspA family protein
MKNILVCLAGFPHDANALEAAFLVGWPFSASIDGLHVQPEPMKIVMNAALHQFATMHSSREVVVALQRQAAAHSAKAKEIFDSFLARRLAAHAFGSAQSGVKATFRCAEGDPIADIVTAARFADMVVTGRAPAHAQFSTEQIANILVGCGRPLLLVPDSEPEAIGRTIAIAWKEKAEAARAVSAAMPLLTRAKKVIVLSIEEHRGDTAACAASAEHLAAQLSRYEIHVQAHGIAAEARNAANVLVSKANELGADLIVSGAYSHSRARELVFGGFTRSLMTACDIPVLLLH